MAVLVTKTACCFNVLCVVTSFRRARLVFAMCSFFASDTHLGEDVMPNMPIYQFKLHWYKYRKKDTLWLRTDYATSYLRMFCFVRMWNGTEVHKKRIPKVIARRNDHAQWCQHCLFVKLFLFLFLPISDNSLHLRLSLCEYLRKCSTNWGRGGMETAHPH